MWPTVESGAPHSEELTEELGKPPFPFQNFFPTPSIFTSFRMLKFLVGNSTILPIIGLCL